MGSIAKKAFQKRLGSTAILASIAIFSGYVLAAPDKPINAADVQTKGDRADIGCIVRASESDAYAYDATCDSHLAIKRDRNGIVKSTHYHDKGELQPWQEAPSRAVRIDIGFGSCSGTEVITPSGAYSSDMICRY